jgi:hypothetical protein
VRTSGSHLVISRWGSFSTPHVVSGRVPHVCRVCRHGIPPKAQAPSLAKKLFQVVIGFVTADNRRNYGGSHVSKIARRGAPGALLVNVKEIIVIQKEKATSLMWPLFMPTTTGFYPACQTHE